MKKIFILLFLFVQLFCQSMVTLSNDILSVTTEKISYYSSGVMTYVILIGVVVLGALYFKTYGISHIPFLKKYSKKKKKPKP